MTLLEQIEELDAEVSNGETTYDRQLAAMKLAGFVGINLAAIKRALRAEEACRTALDICLNRNGELSDKLRAEFRQLRNQIDSPALEGANEG